MYVLIEVNPKAAERNGLLYLYAGTIGGLIVNVTTDISVAKKFSTKTDAEIEIENNTALLDGFTPMEVA